MHLTYFHLSTQLQLNDYNLSYFQDLHAKRPICQKLLDHNDEIIDTSNAEVEDTEYRSTINKMEVG